MSGEKPVMRSCMRAFQSLKARIKGGMNGFTTYLLDIMGARTPCGHATRGLVLIAFAAMTVGSIQALRYSLYSLNANFWLGGLPIITTGLSLICIVLADLVLLYTQALRLKRINESSPFMKKHQGEVERCVCSTTSLRIVLVLNIFACVASIAMASILIQVGSETYESLINHCGEAGISNELEAAQQKLGAFAKTCRAAPDMKGKGVDECKGYKEAFPAPQPYSQYISVMEKNSHCSGFCRFAQEPLFATKGAAPRERCASKIADELIAATLSIGIVTCVCASLILFFALCLVTYSQL
eukprot:gnl/TRDRNA2_/TRDRNA2_185384_c0_seq1.p1 gnl/TRDRNA2_/TRDRNA2_185384_c0~~gnl/TRDRNA2_/TRDRNA2_185384_c0_seq1.p1  ORF type:complete len:298 (+),score=51.27 gnl/TRDRNA2_/TRDRNA2_185384_c0_seq1:88-981(+)